MPGCGQAFAYEPDFNRHLADHEIAAFGGGEVRRAQTVEELERRDVEDAEADKTPTLSQSEGSGAEDADVMDEEEGEEKEEGREKHA